MIYFCLYLFPIDLLQDDLKASVECAKLIVKTEGLKSWQVFIAYILGHNWQSIFVTLTKVVCPFRNLASSYVYHCIISSVLICCACAFLMVMLIFVSAGTPGIVTVRGVRWNAGWKVVRSANKALIVCRRFNYL